MKPCYIILFFILLRTCVHKIIKSLSPTLLLVVFFFFLYILRCNNITFLPKAYLNVSIKTGRKQYTYHIKITTM